MTHTRALPLVLLAASIVVGCGGRTGRARFSSGEDARDGLDASMQKSGVLLSPLHDPPDAPAGGERVTCLEEANGAVERVLKQRYTVTVVLPSAKDDPTPTWPKLPRWVKEADGSRYVARVESARCSATGAEVALSLVDREEGKTLMRTVGESSRERGAAGREAATVAAQKLAFGRLP